MTEPQPVEVKNSDPMPVTVHDRPVDTEAQSVARKVHSAAGVSADILRVEDQRRISGIWERTQQVIALAVVLVTLITAGFKAIYDALSDPERGIAAGPGFLFLVGASNLVIGFYFGRTNHTRVGGTTTRGEGDAGR